MDASVRGSRTPSPSSSPTPSSRFSSPDSDDVAEYAWLMADRLPPLSAVQTIEEQVALMSSRPQARPQAQAQAQASVAALKAAEDDDESGMVDGRPMTKAEKQNAKKKRRKEREKAARADEMLASEAAERAQREERKREVLENEAIPFRLFSCHPIQPVKLLAKQDYPTTSNPLLQAYTEKETSRRRRQAIESVYNPSRAVDVDAEAGPSLPTCPIAVYTPTALAAAHNPLPPTLVLESSTERKRHLPRCAFPDGIPSHPSISLGVEKPVEGPVTSKRKRQALERFPQILAPRPKGAVPRIPRVEATSTRTNGSALTEELQESPRPPPTGSSRRRARTQLRRLGITAQDQREAKRKAPRFWAPEQGVGGKAKGYAWGYRDSREVPAAEDRGGYVRSKRR